jgi:hypothetical protein
VAKAVESGEDTVALNYVDSATAPTCLISACHLRCDGGKQSDRGIRQEASGTILT